MLKYLLPSKRELGLQPVIANNKDTIIQIKNILPLALFRNVTIMICLPLNT